jgi:hypothetical protein
VAVVRGAEVEAAVVEVVAAAAVADWALEA